jgi:hypothetical protein
LAATTLAAFLVLAGTASAYRVPTVHRGQAERQSIGLLREYASWRYKTDGYLDCSRGKINRVTWVCRAGWIKGHSCIVGRVRVTGVITEYDGTRNFDVHFRGKGPYHCVGS